MCFLRLKADPKVSWCKSSLYGNGTKWVGVAELYTGSLGWGKAEPGSKCPKERMFLFFGWLVVSCIELGQSTVPPFPNGNCIDFAFSIPFFSSGQFYTVFEA